MDNAANRLSDLFTARGAQPAHACLRVLGTRHHHLNIDRADFQAWEITMGAALIEFHGANWNTELAEQWRRALDKAIEQVLLGYEDQHHV
jgi:hypothetical protein